MLRGALRAFLLCATSLTICLQPNADEAETNRQESEAHTRKQIFYPTIGIEFRAVGFAFLQDATKTEWPIAVLMGASVEAELLSIGRNRIGIAGAYTHYFGNETDGTAQINVETRRKQADILMTYQFHWTYVSLFVHVGASAGIFSSTTRIYDIGQVGVSSDGESYVFESRELVNEEKNVGAIWGPIAAMGGGLDLGRIASRHRQRKLDNFLFWNLSVQYAEHNVRHEVGLWTSLSVYPMALRK